MKKKVAIQGIAGSYHDIAARNYFEGEEIEIIGCNTFRDVISTIKKDPSILGMMAIENTIAGSLLQNHELIRESGLQVIGEYKLRISHSLVALPGTNIHDVKEVNSHPIALMQCTLDYRYYIYFNIACNNRNITSEVRIEAIKNFIHLFINNNGHQIKHLKNNLMYSYL